MVRVSAADMAGLSSLAAVHGKHSHTILEGAVHPFSQQPKLGSRRIACWFGVVSFRNHRGMMRPMDAMA